MRLAPYVVIGFFALTLVVPTAVRAQADSQSSMRIFDNTNCPQKFSCSDSTSSLAGVANSCIAQGMGVSASFSNSSMDSSNCMTAGVNSQGQHSSEVKCCVVPVKDDDCSMRCFYLSN